MTARSKAGRIQKTEGDNVDQGLIQPHKSDPESAANPALTPDRRYLMVRGRLWRASNPNLGAVERRALVDAFMRARRAVAEAQRAGRSAGLAAARAAVDAAKRGLGERGPVWWTDGAPDLNRRLARNTPYAAWDAALETSPQEGGVDG